MRVCERAMCVCVMRVVCVCGTGVRCVSAHLHVGHHPRDHGHLATRERICSLLAVWPEEMNSSSVCSQLNENTRARAAINLVPCRYAWYGRTAVLLLVPLLYNHACTIRYLVPK